MEASNVKMTIKKPKRKTTNKKDKTKEKEDKKGIYMRNMISRRIYIDMKEVGSNIKQILEHKLANEIEGKCIIEGYIRPGSVKIISYSSGELKASSIIFDIIFECLVCSPVEGMHIECIAKEITETAGIRAETDEQPSPVVIYIARDHHLNMKHYSDVKVGDVINVRVIGQRFELNDKYISIIAELL